MYIEAACPKGHRLKVNKQYAGKTVKCPVCKLPIHIPAPDQEIPGGLVRGVLDPEKAPADAWEFVDEPWDDTEDHGESGSFGELIPMKGGDVIPLSMSVMSVGRKSGCDVVLRHRGISASHAQLRLIDGRWYVSDLKSTNGVKVNGRRVERERLNSGDIVSFGKHEYILKYAPPR